MTEKTNIIVFLVTLHARWPGGQNNRPT